MIFGFTSIEDYEIGWVQTVWWYRSVDFKISHTIIYCIKQAYAMEYIWYTQSTNGIKMGVPLYLVSLSIQCMCQDVFQSVCLS